MYIIKNAFKNLLRNKGRNILISVIIFAVITTTVVALIINNTSEAVIESYKARFSSEVTISVNMQKLIEEAQNENSGSGMGKLINFRQPQISPDLYLEFAKSETLDRSVVTASAGAVNDSILAIDQSADDEKDEETSVDDRFGGRLPSFTIGGAMGNYTLYGDYWQDFTDGNRSLAEGGSFPENDYECVISSDLAEQNSINVDDLLTFTVTFNIDIPSDMDLTDYEDGDTILINDTEYTLTLIRDQYFTASREAEVELTVTGIYYDLTDEYPNLQISGMPSFNRRNEVITTLATLIDIRETDESGVNINATYYLKDPDLLSEFEAYARSLGLDDAYDVTTDSSSYEQIIEPVEGLKSISLTFMLVVVVLGTVIMLLLYSMSVRERKYEIGVLRAIGMKKSKVAAGLWTEILAVTCLCLIVGLIAGTAIAQPVTDILLADQITAENNANNNMPGTRPGGSGGFVTGGNMGGNRGNGGGSFTIGGGNITGNVIRGNSNVRPLSEMKISVNATTIIEIVLIALLLSTLAGMLSISFITKYEPMKILMERN